MDEVASFWGRMADWFCGTNKEAAKAALYLFFHAEHDADKFKAHLELKALVDRPYRSNFNSCLDTRLPLLAKPYRLEIRMGDDTLCQEITLSGADLKGLDLTEVDFRDVDLTNADLSGANLAGTNLGGVILNGARLVGTHLEDAHLKRVSMVKANLSGAHLSRANFTDCTVTGADFQWATLTQANFLWTKLDGASFNRADLSGARLTGVDISKASFTVAGLDGVHMDLLAGNVDMGTDDALSTIIADGIVSSIASIDDSFGQLRARLIVQLYGSPRWLNDTQRFASLAAGYNKHAFIRNNKIISDQIQQKMVDPKIKMANRGELTIDTDEELLLILSSIQARLSKNRLDFIHDNLQFFEQLMHQSLEHRDPRISQLAVSVYGDCFQTPEVKKFAGDNPWVTDLLRRLYVFAMMIRNIQLFNENFGSERMTAQRLFSEFAKSPNEKPQQTLDAFFKLGDVINGMSNTKFRLKKSEHSSNVELQIDVDTVVMSRRLSLSGLDLSRRVLIQCDLHGVNLANANLSGAKIIGADCTEADFTNACLDDAVVQESCMRGAILNGTQLCRAHLTNVIVDAANGTGADLTEAQLVGVSMKSTELRNAKLTKTQMADTDLEGANLMGANLHNANCAAAKFPKANLRRATLTNTTLVKANLSEADCSGADFTGSDLKKAMLFDAVAHGIILNRANLDGTFFSDADLTGASLVGAELQGTRLDFATLTAADFSAARINSVNVRNVDFTDAILAGASFEGMFSNINANVLNVHLNHLHHTNQNGRSVLTAINSIGDDYRGADGSILKLSLMHTLLKDVLSRHNDPEIHPALMDIWSYNPIYYNDKEILDYIQTTILIRQITEGTQGQLSISSEFELRLLLDIVQNKQGKLKEEFMLTRNGFFVQLMMWSLMHDNAAIRSAARALYTDYVGFAELAAAFDYLKIGGFVVPLNDGKGPSFSLIDRIDRDDYVFAFVTAAADGTVNTLMLSRDSAHAMFAVDGDHDWSKFVYYVGDRECSAKINLDQLYEQFTMFKNAYLTSVNQSKFFNLLETFRLNQPGLNNDADPDMINRDYKKIFKDAWQSARSDTKLCELGDQEALMNIFSPLMEGCAEQPMADIANLPTLAANHYGAILRSFSIEQATSLEQAQYLLSLATVFAKLSSSYVFGEETNSPLALRYYATALMKKAYELDPAVFGDAANYTDWMNRTGGFGSLLSCTAIVSSSMVDHIKKQSPGFQKIFNSIKSPAM